MSQKATLADYGLVGVVGGVVAMLGLGVATLAISAMVGRIPWLLGILLAIATTVTLISLAIAITTRDR